MLGFSQGAGQLPSFSLGPNPFGEGLAGPGKRYDGVEHEQRGSLHGEGGVQGSASGVGKCQMVLLTMAQVGSSKALGLCMEMDAQQTHDSKHFAAEGSPPCFAVQFLYKCRSASLCILPNNGMTLECDPAQAGTPNFESCQHGSTLTIFCQSHYRQVYLQLHRKGGFHCRHLLIMGVQK